MTKILIVEDEQNLARFIELELEHENYDVDIEYDGKPGLEKALNNEYNLILLDLMLPNINDLEICRQIRQNKTTHIIIITVKMYTIEKEEGLDYGADDYNVKPFDIEELLDRIRAMLHMQTLINVIDMKGIIIDRDGFKVTVDGEPLDLT